ncbi:L domain-like protein [Gonapodya prolifera JEL478]|uniref:L domain-like protein n=1 Tax=Gonapodya prolifera (strain JEL478) TaxID=1344416 RepID=A0A139A9M1_GONPJ|nr:L domain-like protein [Gonapodya prolifera JEL478]|eukprot:KXS13466.1 L domain-like protein [Gonapodya prolifera JEL478]
MWGGLLGGFAIWTSAFLTKVSAQTQQEECGVFEDLYEQSRKTLPWTKGKCCAFTQYDTGAPSFSCNRDGRITAVYLYGQNLTGSLAPVDGLTELRNLWLYRNGLTGPIPRLSNLKHLQTLLMSYNKLEGPIPEFSGLTQLTVIDLSSNQLSGAIPDFANLTLLATLRLGNNKLSGTVPNLSFLTEMLSFDVGLNSLSGNVDGLLPAQVMDYCRLIPQNGSGLFSCNKQYTADCLKGGQMIANGTASQCSGAQMRMGNSRWELIAVIAGIALVALILMTYKVRLMFRNGLFQKPIDESQKKEFSGIPPDVQSVSTTGKDMEQSRPTTAHWITQPASTAAANLHSRATDDSFTIASSVGLSPSQNLTPVELVTEPRASSLQSSNEVSLCLVDWWLGVMKMANRLPEAGSLGICVAGWSFAREQTEHQSGVAARYLRGAN